MSMLDTIHGGYVHQRRVRRIAGHIAVRLPSGASVLDVGCGDGRLAGLIMDHRPDVTISGIDIMTRPETMIPVTQFDGEHIPFPDGAFDVVMFVDVLHHTTNPMILLREARRVARRCVVLKDHNRNGLFAGRTLRFMDWIGNARHGVTLPYNYWSKQQWRAAFDKLEFIQSFFLGDLGLYPIPADWVFGRSLHFIAQLDVPGALADPASGAHRPSGA